MPVTTAKIRLLNAVPVITHHWPKYTVIRGNMRPAQYHQVTEISKAAAAAAAAAARQAGKTI